MFTTFWLVDLIERARRPEIPDLRNVEGYPRLLRIGHRRTEAMNACGRFDFAELSRRIATPLRFKFTLHVRQCLRLDQQALSFMAATASTEADDDGEPRAFRFDPP